MAAKRSGDRLYAREVNEIVDALGLPTNGRVVSGPGGISVAQNVPPGAAMKEAAAHCLGLNPTGGTDLPNFSPCEITGAVYSSTTAQWRNALKIALPTSAATGKFAICAQAIKAGYAGRVYTSGTALVRIQTNSGDVYADISPGNNYLVGSPNSGSAQILWEDGGPSTTTHLARVRFGMNQQTGSPRWTPLYFNPTPTSSTRIATTSSASCSAGLPIRYQVSGAYYYAIITAVGSGYIDVSGKSVSGTLTGLWLGNAEMIAKAVYYFPGKCLGTAGAIMSAKGLTSDVWGTGPAALCRVRTFLNSVGGGASTINVNIGRSTVLSAGLGTNGQVTGALIASPSIAFEQSIDVSVVATDATDSDLTVSLLFVLA